MTWSPRTCCGKNEEECRSKKAPADSSGHPSQILDTVTSDDDNDDDDDSDYNDNDETEKNNQDKKPGTATVAKPIAGVKRQLDDDSIQNGVKKPKIWSIAETVSSESTKHKWEGSSLPDSTTQSSPYHLVFPPWPRLSHISQQSPSFMVSPELMYRSLLNSSASYLPAIKQDAKLAAVDNLEGRLHGDDDSIQLY